MPQTAPKIEQVDTFLVDVPTIRPHQLAMTTISRQTMMIVRIRTSDGVVGIGEGTTIGGLAYGPESPEGMKLAIDTYFTPILLAADPNRIGRTMATIGASVQGNHFAKCAVETALVDALGKRTGLPASDLLGSRHHDRLPVAWTLASGDTAKDIAEAEDMLARRRHNIFKLKIGKGDARASIAHVAAIKRVLTEEILEEPLDYSNFTLAVPTGPGLGISLNEQALNRFRRDRSERSVHLLKTGS